MDDLGDRIKAYEARETGRRFLPQLPIYCRIDGRNFSRFTRGMDRPFDQRLADVMLETTRLLVEETDAVAGYTQSDEISLLWYREDYKSQVFFDGKICKIVSVTASLATSIFIDLAKDFWPERLKKIAFDSRAFQVPTKEEAANCFLWRELDATKNAISMAARCYYSHKDLIGKNGNEMQEMLFQRGVNFNDYPARFKRGVFVLRRTVMKELDAQTLKKIPPAHRPSGPILRQVVEPAKLPPLLKVPNRVGVLFSHEAPNLPSL